MISHQVLRPSAACRALAALLCPALLLGGCGADGEQARLCAATLGAFVEDAEAVRIVGHERPPHLAHAVTVAWRASDGPSGTLTCVFGGGRFDANRLELVSVSPEPGRWLSERELFWLRRWLAMPAEFLPVRPASGHGPAPRLLPLLYPLQQVINAAALACVYGLLATGYTLVYAVVGQINLAFGELTMLAAIATVTVSALLSALGLGAFPLGLFAVLLLVAATGAAAGLASDRLLFRHLRTAATHVPLIAALGLAVLLQESARLLHGAGDLWLHSPFGGPLPLAGSAAFPVVVLPSQIFLVLLTVLTFGALLRLLHRTRFGLEHRACAEDRATAALLGIDVDRTVARTFLLGGGLAGLAGFVVVTQYGVANFFMGVMLGFKALAAAIVGGIGSVPGAALGAALVAVLEVLWAGYFDSGAKDIAVFALLTLVLVFRPAGLLGRPSP